MFQDALLAILTHLASKCLEAIFSDLWQTVKFIRHRCGKCKNTVEHRCYRDFYSVFHQFRQAKFANGGSILSSSQFLILPSYLKK